MAECPSDEKYCGYDASSKVIGYNAWREKPAPTSYGPHPTAVSYDITLAGLIFAGVILFVSFMLILPGIRGIHRLWAFIRMTVSLFIGLTILLCLHGVDWEYSVVTVDHIPYKAFTKHEINATIGLHIGLKEINITLKGEPLVQSVEENQNETIDYNEQYTFCCGQGRTGFGPFAGRINREFRAAQWRGTPLPILWVLEYFTLDGDNIRWGRAYRSSGWYTNIILWTSFPLWLLSNILMLMVIHYGAYLLAMTGGCMLTANIIFASLRNSLGGEKYYFWTPLTIPLNESELVLKYGWCFWLNMSVGLMCVVFACLIYVLDVLYPLKTALFFNVDPLQDFQDQFVTIDSASGDEKPVSFNAGMNDGSVPATVDLGYDNQPIYENSQIKMVYKPKRKSMFGKNRPSSRDPLSIQRPQQNGMKTDEALAEGDELQMDTLKLTEDI